MHTLLKVAKWLLVVGGINWGLVGLGWLAGGGADWNVVHKVLGSMPTLEGIVYLLVGVSAVLKIFHCKCGTCKNCNCATCGTAPATGGSI